MIVSPLALHDDREELVPGCGRGACQCRARARLPPPDATAEVRLSRPLPLGLLRRSEVAKHDKQYHVIDYLQRSADQ